MFANLGKKRRFLGPMRGSGIFADASISHESPEQAAAAISNGCPLSAQTIVEFLSIHKNGENCSCSFGQKPNI
jgi:hypothetical protein